jgi:hypothetical protein
MLGKAATSGHPHQYKWNPVTGTVHLVNAQSKAVEYKVCALI